jgi:transcriptional regulator with XRE-family HTH domain
MQGLSRNSAIEGYTGGMAIGRPSNRERTEFGEQVFQLREAAGLTQAEVAEQLELSQRAYAAWERDPVAIRPDRLTKLAEVLGTTISELLGQPKPKRSGTPGGRLGQSVEAIGKLPRRAQAKILDVVDAMLAQQSS